MRVAESLNSPMTMVVRRGVTSRLEHARTVPGVSSVEADSLYEAGWSEALRHKWIESEKRGFDMGLAAVEDWYRRYWNRYCRSRRLEHLHGERPWREFAPEEVGLIAQLLEQGDLLLELILDRAHCGHENLDIVNWALDWGMPVDRVISILEQLDLNRGRLDPLGPPKYADPANSAIHEVRCTEQVA